MPESDEQVLPMIMIDPWMQNSAEDFCLGDETAVDHRCRTGPFHSVLICRLWLES